MGEGLFLSYSEELGNQVIHLIFWMSLEIISKIQVELSKDLRLSLFNKIKIPEVRQSDKGKS